MDFSPDLPFNSLPKLPPDGELETRDILKSTIGAHRALGELKGVGAVIPNQSILVNGIVLQEAKASSEIENIVTTNDELYRAMDRVGLGEDSNAKEVLRYREALWHGFEAIRERPINTNLMAKIGGIIRRTDAGIRKTPGTKITGAGGRTVYTPPEGETRIRDLLGNLETYIHAEDGVDPLVKLAVMHYQFEAIHPFTDGNGRTGRILNILFLIEKGLLDVPVLYLSEYIIRTKADYYDGLRRVTEEGAWIDWVAYMLRGIEETARRTKDKVVRIRDLIDDTASLVKDRAPKIHSKELIEAVFVHPYAKIGHLVDAGIGERHTVSKYLNALSELGVMRKQRVGREAYFINEGLARVLAQ